jgi:hypothetical protein
MDRPHVRRGHGVAALFHDGDEVVGVLEELEHLDREDPGHRHHLRVEVHRGHGTDLRAAERTLTRDVLYGMLAMVPVCAVGNAVILWLVALVFDVDDPTTFFWAGVPSGAVLGLLFGGLVGIMLGNRPMRIATICEDAAVDDGDAVVIAEFGDRGRRTADGFAARVDEILRTHRGTPLSV